MKISFWGIIVCIVVIIGIFNPWISKGSKPYSIINSDTGQGELRYNKKIFLSPFYASIFEYHQLVDRIWFVSIGTSISGIMLLSVALLSTIKYERLWVNFVYFIIAALSIVVFFMSLGVGQSVGLKTQIEGGMMVSIIGLFLMFVLSINQMMGHYSIKI
jgi:hypothetical protein